MSIDRRILVADDDAAFRAGVVELLGGFGELLQAEDGEEALAIARRWPLSLALLDMHMPGLTGLDVLRRLREETLIVPCIFWSGDSSWDIEKLALEEGARAVFKKPVSPQDLRLAVRRLLDVSAPHRPDDHGPRTRDRTDSL